MKSPQFKIELEWSLMDLLNYMRSWSAVQKYIDKNESDPVSGLLDRFEKAWGGRDKIHLKRKVAWPLYTKIGRI